MKPTRRTFTILIAAFLLWAFGNQTQVGWLYVMSALRAGFDGSLNAHTCNKVCGSGLQAVVDAAMMVQTGAADVVIAGGVPIFLFMLETL